MDKHHVIAKLRAHEAELKSAGVLSLSLFGSVARGEARPNSDIDLNAQLDKKRRISLFEAIEIEIRLSEILGAKVDLSTAGTLKPDIQEQFEREAALVF
jgi:predicted nucleotidyltransferase